MIKVLIELELVYPYKKSINIFNEFCSIWNCTIVSAGTNKSRASILMPLNKFKKMFRENPQVKKYLIPKGSESFISSWEVKKIITY